MTDTTRTLPVKPISIEPEHHGFAKVAACSSSCRHCRFYRFQGRGNGYCQRLGVPVHGHWRACGLACPPFAPSWESAESSQQ